MYLATVLKKDEESSYFFSDTKVWQYNLNVHFKKDTKGTVSCFLETRIITATSIISINHLDGKPWIISNVIQQAGKRCSLHDCGDDANKLI